MFRADAITLIGEDPAAHGVFENIVRTYRQVPCEVRSVSRNEAYQAMSHNLHPDLVFKLALEDEYQGEKYLQYKNNLYRIIRTYLLEDGIELTTEKVEPNEEVVNA